MVYREHVVVPGLDLSMLLTHEYALGQADRDVVLVTGDVVDSVDGVLVSDSVVDHELVSLNEKCVHGNSFHRGSHYRRCFLCDSKNYKPDFSRI